MPKSAKVFVLAALLASWTRESAADLLCAKKSGVVTIRATRCKARETTVDPAALGLVGSKGDKGDPGPAGPFPTGNLRSGATLRGVFQVAGTDTPAVAGSSASAISFAYPLAAAPEPHLVIQGGLAVPECTGSVSAPTAAAGHLCVYVGAMSNASGIDVGDPVSGIAPGSSRFGVYVTAVGGSDSNYFLSGTWAVTAP